MNILSWYIRHYITPIDPHATILEKLKKKRQALLACQRDNAATKKKKATKRARQLEVQAAEKATHQATESMNATKRSNKHFQTMILGMLQSIKQTGMTEHNPNIDSVQCQVQLNMEYQDDDYRSRIRNLLLLARKTDCVHCEVCHLYSLKQMISPEDIVNFFPVNLETRLHQHPSYQTRWIQRT